MNEAISEQSLFAELLRCDTDEARDARLHSACGDNPVLLRRMQALLRAAQISGDFLETPPAALRGNELNGTGMLELLEQPGTRISSYKLLEQIGEGGCGVVYMAEQEKPVRRRVAVKIIKQGMATKDVVARFEAERQALAMMEHPNIARVFDGGTTPTGRPFFVMELVRGLRITEYCDEARLSTADRLQLFVQVCHAVQHAHQKGVIHRDLKPSNILVTVNDGMATPKVIDFGIAKAINQKLTDKTLFTQFHSFIGTPSYTSPEQAEMSSVDVDTRSDIYSLGVLLYELLTGEPPFDGEQLLRSGLDEMRRVIRQVEPARPSTKLSTFGVSKLTELAAKRGLHIPDLTRETRGDLDWIVMRCLEKDRARRYETADSLATDIQRHLNDEPVTARPQSAAYRLHKLLRRHRTAVSVAALFIVTLLLGCTLTTVMYLKARRAQKTARSEAAVSAAVNQFLQDDLLKQSGSRMSYQWRFRKDSIPSMLQILDRAGSEVAIRLKDQPLVEAAVRHAIGVGYINVGSPTSAVPHLQRAFELRRDYDSGDVRMFDSLKELAMARMWSSQYKEAIQLLETYLPFMERRFGPGDPRILETQTALAFTRFKASQSPSHVHALEQIRDSIKRASSPESDSYIECSFWLAEAYRESERNVEATAIHQELLRTIQVRFGNNHPAAFQQLLRLADSHDRDSRSAQAIPFWREALALGTALYGLDDSQTVYALNRLGQSFANVGKTADALQLYHSLLNDRVEKLPPGDREVLKVRQKIGWCYVAMRQLKQGIDILEDVRRLQVLTLGDEDPDTQWTIGDLGFAYLDAGRAHDAIPLLEKNLEFQKSYLGWQDSHTWFVADRLLAAYEGVSNSVAAESLKKSLPMRTVSHN